MCLSPISENASALPGRFFCYLMLGVTVSAVHLTHQYTKHTIHSMKAEKRKQIFASLDEKFLGNDSDRFRECIDKIERNKIVDWLEEEHRLNLQQALNVASEWYGTLIARLYTAHAACSKEEEISLYLQKTYKLDSANATALVKDMMEQAREKAETAAPALVHA